MALRLGTLTDAADILCMDEKTIRRYIASGQLVGYRVGPRVLRVNLDEVEALAKPIPTAAAS